MPDSLRSLRQAAAILTYLDDEAPSRDVVAKAVREVWLASADWGRWPERLREDAQRLVSLAFRDGAIRYTVQRLTAEEIGEVVGLIRRLAIEAERLGEPNRGEG